MLKNMKWIIPDYVDQLQLKRFTTLIGDRVSINLRSNHLALGDNLLFFNPVQRHLSKDGYLDYQTPSRLTNDNDIMWNRRVWAGGEMQMFKPLQIGQQYYCQEKIKFLKKIGNNYYVGIERSISHSKEQRSLQELRTLVYTSSLVRGVFNEVKTPGKPIGIFKFCDLDIIMYGQLTLNPHRVHWDKNYTQDIEGYKNIIVQGPFAVQVLMAFAESFFAKPLKRVSYKNLNVIYPETEMEICAYHNYIYMRDKYSHNIIYVSAQCFFE